MAASSAITWRQRHTHGCCCLLPGSAWLTLPSSSCPPGLLTSCATLSLPARPSLPLSRRKSIDVLKEMFRDEMTKDDWILVMKLKKVFKID
jgi:hypothetical protein